MKPSSKMDEIRRLAWPTEDLEHVGTCPLCHDDRRSLLHDGLWDNSALAAHGQWSLWRCTGCRSAYLDPRPNQASIGRAYETYYTHQEERPPDNADRLLGRLEKLNLSLANGYRNWRYGTESRPSSSLGALLGAAIPLLRTSSDYAFRYLPSLGRTAPRVLDVGCGGGHWLMRAAQTRWRVHGVDLDAKAVTMARARGLDVREGGIEAWGDARGEFDAVTLSNVIEHVHDPKRMLRMAFELLRPGGMLFVETPNIDALGHGHFGRAWRGLEPPRHLVLFNLASLIRLLRQVGFQAITQPHAPMLLDGIWAESQSLRQLEPGASQNDQRPPSLAFRLRSRIIVAQREFLIITCRKPA